MILRKYVVQRSKSDLSAVHLFKMNRVDYTALQDSLIYPVVWVYHHYLQAWLPSEATDEFIYWLVQQDTLLENVSEARLLQLKMADLLEPQFSTEPQYGYQLSWEQLKSNLARDGFVKIPSLFSKEYSKSFLTPYYYRNFQWHQRWNELEGISRSSANNIPLMRLVHQSTQNLVSFLVPEQIKTSYSFSASYDAGSSLPAHTDRPQCVYNISLILGSQPFDATLSDWPLMITHDGNTTAVGLEAGDAVLYSGVRDLHWRDKMPEELKKVNGVFFHYVPQEFTGSLD